MSHKRAGSILNWSGYGSFGCPSFSHWTVSRRPDRLARANGVDNTSGSSPRLCRREPFLVACRADTDDARRRSRCGHATKKVTRDDCNRRGFPSIANELVLNARSAVDQGEPGLEGLLAIGSRRVGASCHPRLAVLPHLWVNEVTLLRYTPSFDGLFEEVPQHPSMMLKGAIFLFLHLFCDIALAAQCGKVWLTVSSLWRPIAASDKVVDAELEVNWDLDCPSSAGYPDTIKVFTADPAHNKTVKPKLILTSLQHPRGYYRTNITVGRPPLPGGWDTKDGATLPGPHCLKHHAALYKDGAILTSSCLQIWPTWMYDLRRQLGRLPIGSLMIPGTHNSGCYKHGDLTRRDAFQRYLLTQDRDVWTQLVHGIRYLDVRVGYYPSIPNGTAITEEGNHTSRFWINHDVIRITPLSAVIKDVRNFLNVARGEVVIMDFHRFPVGFEGRPSRHRRLAMILWREFEGLILKPDRGVEGLGPTLNDIWTGGKRLIICYGDKHTVNEYDWLWPTMSQAWGNQQTVEGLFKYLDEVIMGPKMFRNSQNPLWAVMAELTPYPLDIIFNLSGGLRQMANSVNRNLTFKFQEEWWKETNIVATDFFLGNNLIDVSIQANIKKSNIAQWRL